MRRTVGHIRGLDTPPHRVREEVTREGAEQRLVALEQRGLQLLEVLRLAAVPQLAARVDRHPVVAQPQLGR